MRVHLLVRRVILCAGSLSLCDSISRTLNLHTISLFRQKGALAVSAPFIQQFRFRAIMRTLGRLVAEPALDRLSKAESLSAGSVHCIGGLSRGRAAVIGTPHPMALLRARGGRSPFLHARAKFKLGYSRACIRTTVMSSVAGKPVAKVLTSSKRL